jgi:hypothetical protein
VGLTQMLDQMVVPIERFRMNANWVLEVFLSPSDTNKVISS